MAQTREEINAYKRDWDRRNPARKKASNDRWKAKNPEKVNWDITNLRLKSLYGITEDYRDKMAEDQDYKCACCGIQFSDAELWPEVYPEARQVDVDHDHSYERGDPEGVRALVCNDCNMRTLTKKVENMILNMDPSETGKWYSVKDAVVKLGVDITTIYNWIRKGDLKNYGKGTSRLVWIHGLLVTPRHFLAFEYFKNFGKMDIIEPPITDIIEPPTLKKFLTGKVM